MLGMGQEQLPSERATLYGEKRGAVYTTFSPDEKQAALILQTEEKEYE